MLAVLAGMVVTAGYRLVSVPAPLRAATATTPGWDYQTASVDLGSLTPKLMELSKDGWEVVSIISIDTLIDQQPDGKTHIVTQRVEVTARRAK